MCGTHFLFTDEVMQLSVLSEQAQGCWKASRRSRLHGGHATIAYISSIMMLLEPESLPCADVCTWQVRQSSCGLIMHVSFRT